jgi:uncharacterized protein
MLFKRAKPVGFGERLRCLFWPRRSWTRSAQYVLLRLKRVPSSPHRIALGAAAGVFAVFTPFLGAQLMLAGVIAWIMRGSLLASFLASFVGNPITYPIIWFATFNLGNVLIGAKATARLVDLRGKATALWDSIINGSLDGAAHALESLWPIVKPMVVGSLPLGLFAAVLCYVGVRRLIAAAQLRKRQRVGMRTAAQIGS